MSLSSKTLVMPLVAGLALGLLVQRLGIAPGVRTIGELQVLGTLWTNAMVMTVVPLVAVGIICTFASDYGKALLGRLGFFSLLLFMLILAGAALATMLIAPLFLSTIRVEGWTGPNSMERATGVGTAAMGVQPVSGWITSLIPPNPIKALSDGFLPGVIFFAIALGAAIAHSSDATRTELRTAFESVQAALVKLVEIVLKAAPFGVFILALSFGTRLGAGGAGAAAVYVVLVCLACIVVGLLLYPLASIAGGIGIRQFARACSQPQIIAAASRSTLAALPASIESAKKHMNVRPQLSSAVLPFGEVFFSPGAVIAQVAGLLVLAHLYNRDITILTLLSFAFIAVAASARSPGSLASATMVMVPLYVAAGIPHEGIGVLLGLDAIPQSFRSALNVTGNMAVAAIVSRHQASDADSLAASPSTV